MKRLFYLMTLTMTMFMSSCFGEAQLAYDGEYYDYMNNWSIIYYNQIPYYRIWENYQWMYRPVPRERIPYIRIRPDYNRGRGFTPQRGFQPRPQGQQGGQPQRSQGIQQGTLRSGFQPNVGMQSQPMNRGGNMSGGMTRGGMTGGGTRSGGGSMGGGRR